MTRSKAAILGALLLLFLSPGAWAANGNQLTGVGPIQGSMSGAGVAAPLDSTAIIQNPAGMIRVPDRLDFSVEMAFPTAHMNTSAAPAGNAAAGNQSNKFELLPLPAISAVMGLMDGRMAFGIGFFNTSGSVFSYSQSRINPAITGNAYDKYVDLKIYKVVPALSYAILDNLSVGLAIHADFASLGADFAVASNGYAETAGRGHNDYSPGIGASLGVLYSPLPELSLGLCYTSPQFFKAFGDYSDVTTKRPDNPMQLKVGVAGTPFDMWLLALDFHWINWSASPLYGSAPADGGLGWRDQFIVDFGTQVRIGRHLRLRAGYGFGNSPISSGVAFVNAIAPMITEHNITFGLSVDISRKWAINGAFVFNPNNRVTQSATTDPMGQAGLGATAEMTAYAATVGLSYNWADKIE
jgi:long-chain fatty acid transport protein